MVWAQLLPSSQQTDRQTPLGKTDDILQPGMGRLARLKTFLQYDLELEIKFNSKLFVRNWLINVQGLKRFYENGLPSGAGRVNSLCGREQDLLYIFKYETFPIGHPVIYVGDDRLAREGIIKCKVLRPRNFYHPMTGVYSLRYSRQLLTVIESGHRTI